MYEKLKADVAFLGGDYIKAAQMFLEGARDGDALASFNYGWCLWRGIGVKYDPKEAKSYFSFARDLEGGVASYNLAMLYLHGEGVPKDYKRACEHMRVSASKGCIEAQLYLGAAHTSGCMFEPDVVGISMIPYHKPEYRTDTLLLEGDVSDFELDEHLRYSAISYDPQRAFTYFRAASRHDPTYVSELVSKGKYLYALCYADGLGTDADYTRASRLMFAAKRAGSKDAEIYILENGLTDPALEAKQYVALKGR